MFVKLENYYGGDKHLILNVNNIHSIEHIGKEGYCVVMNTKRVFSLDEEQYKQLCYVLTKKI